MLDGLPALGELDTFWTTLTSGPDILLVQVLM